MVGGSQAAIPELEKLAQNLYISASSIAQVAALACFTEESMTIFEQRRAEFAARRDFYYQPWATGLQN